MGRWPAIKPRYYTLRISNFRTVRPTDEEIRLKQAVVREYTAGGNTKENVAGFLVTWNERTKNIILSDDTYPVPIDGVRIGVVSKDGKARQGVVANILVMMRARICEPRLYLYRVQDGLETIDNEMIQHVRKMCAAMTIEEVYTLGTTLESDDPKQLNPILSVNGFGDYMRKRYGFKIKGASFQYVTLLGAAADALDAPYIARQNADAAAIKGDGAGQAEKNKLGHVGDAFEKLVAQIGLEAALQLRALDAATAFAESGNASTVVLGFDPKNVTGSSLGAAAGKILSPTPQPKPKPGEGEIK
jgi:regulator of protease activity HflC (stomatin/prohibitin superfamily)